jgi:hypothetical protein
MRILKWIVVAGLLFLLICFALTKPQQDFIEYWVSAHLLTAGANPYSLPTVFHLEKALGWSEPVPLMNLTPPWAMPLIAPIGLMKSYAVAWLLWVGSLTAVMWYATKLLLELYSGEKRIFPKEPRWREPILAFTFYHTVVCLKFAQITPFVLLGIAGFLWCDRRKRYGLAGACLALATFKPHLVYLVWFALLLWSWQTKKWRTLLSMTATIALLSAVGLLFRPSLAADYLALSRSGYTRIWPSAFGAILRFPFGTLRAFPLQFVAPALGTVWFFFYWRRHKDGWDWKAQMPLLITVSVMTTAYGWIFDQILLLVPIVAIAARYAHTEGRLPRNIVKIYTYLNIAVCVVLFVDTALPFLLAPLTVATVLRRQARGAEAVSAAYSETGSEA